MESTGSIDECMSSGIHLVIIGAGLAGLAAAISTKIANPNHQVTILESTKELGEIGAGLQLTPNATRLFKPWGIHDRLAPKVTSPQTLTVRRYDGTKILAHEPAFQSQVSTRYFAPFWGIHRVDLHHAMATRCTELGVTIRLNSKVLHVDFIDNEAELENGEWVKGDAILCADGLWSATRSQFLGRPSKAILTGDLAYRVVIHAEDITGPDAEELRGFVRRREVNFWVGPGMHVVAYAMRAESVYNIVLLCPDDLPANVSKSEGDVGGMRMLFENWDPLLGKFLEQVREVKKWKLMTLPSLQEWCNPEGTFWMTGDSCHPMLPYLAQGANSSLEDGAVIGYLLSKVAQEKKEEQLPKAAKMYQDLRKERGEMIRNETVKQREDFHLEDGEEQEERDRYMEVVKETGVLAERDFPSRWTCERTQGWLWGYDAYKVVEEAFERDPY